MVARLLQYFASYLTVKKTLDDKKAIAGKPGEFHLRVRLQPHQIPSSDMVLLGKQILLAVSFACLARAFWLRCSDELNGDSIAEMPIEPAAQLDLAVNLRTARDLDAFAAQGLRCTLRGEGVTDRRGNLVGTTSTNNRARPK